MRGLETYIRTKPQWRQWKSPAAWLNGERWNDECDTAHPQQAATGDEAIRIVIQNDINRQLELAGRQARGRQ
jgi:hypothetical protein